VSPLTCAGPLPLADRRQLRPITEPAPIRAARDQVQDWKRRASTAHCRVDTKETERCVGDGGLNARPQRACEATAAAVSHCEIGPDVARTYEKPARER